MNSVSRFPNTFRYLLVLIKRVEIRKLSNEQMLLNVGVKRYYVWDKMQC